ncbi:hypothetical protein L210DRAFT_3553086 [Boletus edulis BED1]|uniref:Uncharacterized protein n=1 Tax=Boletus edulis BED1 TaxID=1328754 RepID=A0AAD4BMS6_BOLED|nr:hypothetical protein L210DRAFT_3553086 [Boletus edulis BED1]
MDAQISFCSPSWYVCKLNPQLVLKVVRTRPALVMRVWLACGNHLLFRIISTPTRTSPHIVIELPSTLLLKMNHAYIHSTARFDTAVCWT